MKKEISSIGLAFQAIGLIKTILIAFFMAMMEYLRIRAVKAEDNQAYAETNLRIKETHEDVDKKNNGKSANDIIADFLNGE